METPKGFIDNFIVGWLLKQLEKVISDPAKVRELILNAGAFLEDLAEKTATKWDDYVVDGLLYVANDDEAFAYAYGKIYALYQAIVNGKTDEDGNPLPLPSDVELTCEAEEAGLNPALIVALIQAAVVLFKWWRDRRGEK